MKIFFGPGLPLLTRPASANMPIRSNDLNSYRLVFLVALGSGVWGAGVVGGAEGLFNI